jgi:serine/threonine protein kinase
MPTPVKIDLRLGDPSQPWDGEGSTTILKSTLSHTTPMPNWHAEIDLLFPEFSVIAPIASGALSRVFELVDRSTQEPFALKAMPFTAEISSLRERLEREWQVLTMLMHPNIVRGYMSRRSDTTFYLLMELISGMTLQQKVGRHGPLPYRLAAKYIGEAACGLAAAHAAGIIHRDVKPSNLLLDRSGAIKVIDFGMALMNWAGVPSITLQHEDTLLGTVDYMAPEQALSSHNIDALADVYSLGCTLFFLLTGRPPFPDGSIAARLLRHRKEAPPDLRTARPDVPQSLVTMFERMVAKAPEDRFASMDVVRDVAEQFLVEDLTSHPAEETHAPKDPPINLRWRPIGSRRPSRDTSSLERLVTSLTSTLQEAPLNQPVSPSMAEILGTLRDRIEEVLRARPAEASSEPQPVTVGG